MKADPSDLRKTVQAYNDELTLALLASLDHVMDVERLPEELRVPAVDAFIDASLGVAQARQLTGPFAASGHDWMAPYRAMLTSESVARQMLKIPAPPSFENREQAAQDLTPTIASQLAESRQVIQALAEQVAAVTSAAKVRTGMSFSEAAERYINKKREAHEDDHSNIGYFLNVSKAFIALCGDKPVDAYDEDDLQHFVNECSYLPPNFTKRAPTDADYSQVKLFIDANRAVKGQGLSAGTLHDSYLGRVRTLISFGCRKSKVTSGIVGAKITIPDRAAPRRASRLIDGDILGKIINKGIDSGVLADALLPSLGILTGRRIALLATMRREDLVQVHGVWMVFPESHRQNADGSWVRVPHKSAESLQPYVLSTEFERCGFIAWATKSPGYVFEHLMEAKDPADAAQKRMARLFRSVGADPRTVGTFHTLRHSKIANDRAVQMPPRLIRVQAGHSLGDVHDAIYGGLTKEELERMRNAPLPAGVDWDRLSTIDFEALARKRPTGGRPVGTKSFARRK